MDFLWVGGLDGLKVTLGREDVTVAKTPPKVLDVSPSLQIVASEGVTESVRAATDSSDTGPFTQLGQVPLGIPYR